RASGSASQRSREVTREQPCEDLGLERDRTEARLLGLDGEVPTGRRVLDRLAEVAEDERGDRDHVVRVDELVAVLKRLRDRQAALVVCIRLAEVSELTVGVADRIETERDLA